jgi:nitrite reductase (NO-forming)
MMNPRHTLSLRQAQGNALLLALLALAAGGCKTQPPSQAVDAEFTLETAMLEGSMAFVGVGGEIDGIVNPDLNVGAGDTIRVVLVNGDGIPHDFAIPDLNAHTELITRKAQNADVIFQVGEAGEFAYYCSVAGHRQMGMEGRLIAHEP